MSVTPFCFFQRLKPSAHSHPNDKHHTVLISPCPDIMPINLYRYTYMSEQKTTHFGYQEVPIAEKAKKVSAVFDSVTPKYNLMNDVMSLGTHRLWKQLTVELSAVRNGQHVLDVASGTGDLAKLFAKRVGQAGHVTCTDINASMLKEGQNCLTNQGVLGNITYVQSDAENLPFPDNSFHCICIAFGLRNVTRKDKALASLYRVLKPAGQLLILEFSKPRSGLLNKIYDAYSFHVIPRLGSLITGDEESYRYLAESIRKHPNQDQLKNLLKNTGFNQVRYHNFTGGIVALHRAYKS